MIKSPLKVTLDKYGLSEKEWRDIFDSQNGCCAICKNPFQEGKRINTDHHHVKGWKKMLPEDRKQHVRGILCYTCNHSVLTRYATIEKLKNAITYLENHERKSK